MKKKFWPILSRNIEWDKLQGTIYGVHMIFWQLLWKVQDHFCNTYEVVGNTIFEKKTQFFQWRKDFGLFFSHSRVSQTWGAILWISTRCFDSCCGSYKTLCVTHKRLFKTQILGKKRKLSSEEKLLACCFSQDIDCFKPQGKIYKGPQGILKITVEVKRAII